MSGTSTLFECISCKENVNQPTFLLPCLHTMCGHCVNDVVTDSQHKGKRACCIDCGEIFAQEALATIPTKLLNEKECAECGAAASHSCSACNEHFCKLHGDVHPTMRKTKGHVMKHIGDVSACKVHVDADAVAYCTNCNFLICLSCTVNEHGAHVCISLTAAAAKQTAHVQANIRKLLQNVPSIEKEINKHKNKRAQFEKERAEFESKIAEVRAREKVETLQIDDLEQLKSLLLTASRQVEALVAAENELSQATIFRLNEVVAMRIANFQTGLTSVQGFVFSSAIKTTSFTNATFSRLSNNMHASNNGKTLTKNVDDEGWGFGIFSEGCSSGTCSWRFIINAITHNTQFMIGVWNSNDVPSNNDSSGDPNTWAVAAWNACYKGGAETSLSLSTSCNAGDVIILSVDCTRHRLIVQNTTQGWTYRIDQLPSPNPVYYPHVSFLHENDSLTIENLS